MPSQKTLMILVNEKGINYYYNYYYYNTLFQYAYNMHYRFQHILKFSFQHALQISEHSEIFKMLFQDVFNTFQT